MVAAGTLNVELKFIHSCGQVGEASPVVVLGLLCLPSPLSLSAQLASWKDLPVTCDSRSLAPSWTGIDQNHLASPHRPISLNQPE